jgi:hypothetical protein
MDPQAELLLLRASEDRAALALDLPDGLFGFVAQQQLGLKLRRRDSGGGLYGGEGGEAFGEPGVHKAMNFGCLCREGQLE